MACSQCPIPAPNNSPHPDAFVQAIFVDRTRLPGDGQERNWTRHLPPAQNSNTWRFLGKRCHDLVFSELRLSKFAFLRPKSLKLIHITGWRFPKCILLPWLSFPKIILLLKSKFPKIMPLDRLRGRYQPLIFRGAKSQNFSDKFRRQYQQQQQQHIRCRSVCCNHPWNDFCTQAKL